MINPVPEVAFPHVCSFFASFLAGLAVPLDTEGPVVHVRACSLLASVPYSLAIIIDERLHAKGYLCYRVVKQGRESFARAQLTAKGYLFALELQRQKTLDAAKPTGYEGTREEAQDGFRSGKVEGRDQQGGTAEGSG